ncbi:MAG TPA: LD-carboxypeptidase [Longimicrobiales bacterium]|nr:LD-carboxypeptidase [Longimicrobiales bacterium]
MAPAGPVAEDRIEVALHRCAGLGLDVRLAPAARGRHGTYLAAPDDARLADLQAAFDDPDVDAVWALRGGYGTMRVLARLDLSGVAAAPKAFIGFSDNTALHLALHARGVVSYHGPNAGSDVTELTETCLHRVLFRAEPAGLLPVPADRPARVLHGGTAEGTLIGGNLALLAAMAGTPAALGTDGRILFVEDVGETAYRLDRAWTQLALSGALDGVAGVAFGRFTDCGEGVMDLLAELTAPLGVPVLADLPFGHEPDNWTLPLGVRGRLAADAGTLSLLEPGVS